MLPRARVTSRRAGAARSGCRSSTCNWGMSMSTSCSRAGAVASGPRSRRPRIVSRWTRRRLVAAEVGQPDDVPERLQEQAPERRDLADDRDVVEALDQPQLEVAQLADPWRE